MLFEKREIKKIIFRLFALFASVRGYIILTLIAAQYLSARYIFAPQRSWKDIIFDTNLFLLVLATSLAIAGGYIINNFYDAEKDRINRPYKYALEHQLSVFEQLFSYFLLNIASVFLAAWVSLRTVPFFISYIVGIWLYSHLLKKQFWASNLFVSLLAIVPFFAITLYFRNFSSLIFYHAAFLFLVILTRDFLKDLQNFKGDWVRQYKTSAVVFGEKVTKRIITVLLFLTLIPIQLILLEKEHIGSMYYYYITAIPFLFIILLVLWNSPTQKTYLWLHNLLKLLILTGVASIILVRFPLSV